MCGHLFVGVHEYVCGGQKLTSDAFTDGFLSPYIQGFPLIPELVNSPSVDSQFEPDSLALHSQHWDYRRVPILIQVDLSEDDPGTCYYFSSKFLFQ